MWSHTEMRKELRVNLFPTLFPISFNIQVGHDSLLSGQDLTGFASLYHVVFREEDPNHLNLVGNKQISIFTVGKYRPG